MEFPVTGYSQMWVETALMLTLGMMLVLPGLWLVSNLFVPLLPAVRVVRTRLLPGLANLSTVRQISRTEISHHPRDFFDGRIVRLRGRVVDEAVGRGEAGEAVVSRQLVRNSLGGVRSEGFLAHDFDLVLESGELVRVHAEGAATLRSLVLLDGAEDHWEEQGLTRGWFCESRLHPGDEIEVMGTLLRELDPRAAAHGFRQAPVRWSLIAGPSQPVVLRFATTASQPRLTALRALG
jgi:hypothetical protein